MHIGSGHVMRCLTLADALRERDAEVSFICCNSPGNLNEIIKKKGYVVHRLSDEESTWEEDARQTTGIIQHNHGIDWLAVDHYSLDRRWEMQTRPYTKKILVIDDLADRYHDCDLLLDQNFYAGMETRYGGLVPSACAQFLGPKYALLRPEFALARQNLITRDGSVGRILLFFGASDRTNETEKALKAVARLDSRELVVDVVIGINNIHRQKIEAMAANIPAATCHFQIADMAALIVAADLFVGAAGITTWERCCLGLPSLVVTVAETQVPAVRDLANHRCLHYIGHHNDVGIDSIFQSLRHVLGRPDILREYSQRSMELVDGQGAERCAEALRKS